LFHLDGRTNFNHIFNYFPVSGCSCQGLLQRLVFALLQVSIHQLIREKLIPIGPIFGVFREHFSKKVLNFWWYYWFLGEGKFFLLDDEDEFGDAAAFERAVAEEHAEEHYPQRPNVSLDGVRLSLQQFGRHVDGRAEHRPRNLILGLEGLAEAEISQLDGAVVEQQVFGFEVAVHDAVPVEQAEGTGDLHQKLESSGNGERAALSEKLFKSAAVAVLIDEVVVIGGFEHVDVADDVGMGVERGENVDLVERAFLELGALLELGRVHHLYGHFLLRLRVECAEDRGVGPSADLCLQVVVLDDLAHYDIITSRHQ